MEKAKKERNEVSSRGSRRNKKVSQITKRARSAEIARAGIETSEDMKNLMAKLIPDILEGDVSIAAANATCNAAGKMIKVVELELRYGKEGTAKTRRVNNLRLVGDGS